MSSLLKSLFKQFRHFAFSTKLNTLCVLNAALLLAIVNPYHFSRSNKITVRQIMLNISFYNVTTPLTLN